MPSAAANSWMAGTSSSADSSPLWSVSSNANMSSTSFVTFASLERSDLRRDPSMVMV